jgi:two-component system cell cycle sensor histidine kinase/response regulator CckA
VILPQSPATIEVSTAAQIIQFAAVLVEMGGAILIAILFVVASRSSQRREYFRTWTVAWVCMAIAISSIAARYLLLNRTPAGLPPEHAPEVRALYWLYEAAKFGYWVLVWRGAAEYVGHGVAGESTRWRWLGAAIGASTVGWFFYRDLNDLLVWQAPFAVACCAAATVALLRLPNPRRTTGSTSTGVVLGVTTLLWILYFAAFATATKILEFPIGPIMGPLLSYNTYADLLMLLVLGYSMLMMFMEDASRRIADIETRLDGLVMTAPEPILTIDAQHRVIALNRAAEAVFGGGARRSAGAQVTDLVESADRDRLRQAIDDFTASEEATRHVGDGGGWLHGLRADGSTFTAEFTLSRLFDADVNDVSVVVRDLTVRREQEERRRQASTMEAVRQLAGGLAHDFNNLLTTIVGRSQIVARTLPTASTVREDVVQIEQAAAAAARLSRGLLALSRREPLNPERLSIDDAIRAAEPAIRGTLAGIECTLRLGACDTHAHLDRARFSGVLMALVQNAREAMGETGTLTIETTRATLPQPFGANVEAACITIRDTGGGLDADARAHLFEPFFSTKGDGRGLGLATAWAFVHQSGGTVDLESGREGTMVRILFPVAARSAADAAPPAASLSIVTEQPRRRRTVLVAEDEASVRKSVRIFLERAGYTVIEAPDGVEALAAFERAADEIGMLLTDVMMPQMGGRELAMKIMELRPDLPVVFMSGFLRDPEVLRMVNDRRVRFLAKPFDVDALVATVHGEMGNEEAHVA